MKILLVDDDTALADALSRAIVRWQHQVDVIATGRGAAELAQNCPYEVILLDLFLSDGRGDAWIPAFKRHLPEAYIITMTGRNTPDMEKQVRSLGITYYMAKPIPYQELKMLLDHLSQKQNAKEKSP